MRSPDASLLRLERWQALSAEQLRGFAPRCLDLVVEIASPTDEGPRGVSALRRRMATYQANGARLGWLLLQEERAVEIRPVNGEGSESAPVRLEEAEVLEGAPEFPCPGRRPSRWTPPRTIHQQRKRLQSNSLSGRPVVGKG